jgi:hypothetical protein
MRWPAIFFTAPSSTDGGLPCLSGGLLAVSAAWLGSSKESSKKSSKAGMVKPAARLTDMGDFRK